MFRVFLFLPVVLAACAGAQYSDIPQRRAQAPGDLPPMKVFSASDAPRATRPNAEMARDFLDLSFMMESGRKLPVMTRFEGPVRVRVTGTPPATLGPDLARVLSRLRQEAGLDISRVNSDAFAEITIEAIPQAKLQRYVPQAACFVVPNLSSFAEFRRFRGTKQTDWTRLSRRSRVAIFIPSDVSPQEIRDCLHEELAQALGPLNDLYRLPDSVFNDDNFHAVLTGFDMLMLRIYYAPQLRNGMTRQQAAQVVPGLLARFNPSGQKTPGPRRKPTPRAWVDSIEQALGTGVSQSLRRKAAQNAVKIAESEGWTDPRRAFSYFALGRLSLATDAQLALKNFLLAGRLYGTRPETRIQTAHVAMQLAAFALSVGDGETALLLTNNNLKVVTEAENAALLATLLMMKSEALGLVGRLSESRAVRLDSLGWARYGFGSEKAVRNRLNEIAALSPGRI